MKAKCSVTFEFPTRPGLTWKGEMIGTTPAAVVRRATEQASKELKPRNWSSLVCVILERDDVEPEEQDSNGK